MGRAHGSRGAKRITKLVITFSALWRGGGPMLFAAPCSTTHSQHKVGLNLFGITGNGDCRPKRGGTIQTRARVVGARLGSGVLYRARVVVLYRARVVVLHRACVVVPYRVRVVVLYSVG